MRRVTPPSTATRATAPTRSAKGGGGGKQHRGPGSYQRCPVCRHPVPLKYSECDQCGMMALYVGLVEQFDAVDITADPYYTRE